MKNEYEIRGDVTAIFIDSPKYGKFETIISTKQLERAKEFPYIWRVTWDRGIKSFYIRGALYLGNRKQRTILLHRWITNAPDGMVVDHIDHDTLNNTDSNLRIITIAQNAQNRKGAQRGSKSGVRGVIWDKNNNKWVSTIKINGVQMYLGSFDTIKDAEQVSITARMHHMPYSPEASL
jgi:hypothetical protein